MSFKRFLPLLALLTAAPTAARAADAEPPRLPPYVVRVAEGVTFQPLFAAQLRLSWTRPADAPEPDPLLLEIRRLRLGFRARALHDDLELTLQLNTTPSALELLDLFADYRLHPLARLRVGQLKVPFTRYRLLSFTTLDFVEWAPVSRPFGSERQLGVELHDRGARVPWEYGVGVFSGTPARAAFGTGVATVYGERPINYSDLRTFNPPEPLHPELVGRLAYHIGRTEDTTSVTPPPGFAAVIGASASWDADPTLARDLEFAIAPEIWLRHGPLSAQSTFYLGTAERFLGGAGPALWGLHAEASFLASRRVGVALRYSRLDRVPEASLDARARAGALVAAASPEDQEDLAEQYRGVGRVRREQELLFGLNVFFVGRSLTWQTDYGWTFTTRDDGERREPRGRTQLLLAF